MRQSKKIGAKRLNDQIQRVADLTRQRVVLERKLHYAQMQEIANRPFWIRWTAKIRYHLPRKLAAIWKRVDAVRYKKTA